MSRVLLDSIAYARYVAGDRIVSAALGDADEVLLSVIVLGELLAGFRTGSHEARNKEILSAFLEKPTVSILSATGETADYYGRIWASLRRAGRPIPTNDVWIAAQALETGALLITYYAHFADVPGLRIWDGFSGTSAPAD